MPSKDRGCDLVLFVSQHDASRGPLAAALFNHLASPARARGFSAGFFPARAMSRLMPDLLADGQLALSRPSPTRLTSADLEVASLIVHIGRVDSRGWPSNQIAWEVPTIRPATLDRARRIRTHLELRVACLVAERGWLGDLAD
jgi:arsenate reductase